MRRITLCLSVLVLTLSVFILSRPAGAEIPASIICGRAHGFIVRCDFKFDSSISSFQAIEKVEGVMARQRGITGLISCKDFSSAAIPATGAVRTVGCSAESVRGLRRFFTSKIGWSTEDFSDRLWIAFIWIIAAGLTLVALFRSGKPDRGGLIKLLTESTENNNLSLGRVSFWIVFLVAIDKFVMSGRISPQHESLLGFLLVYNLGKKGLDAWNNMKGGGSSAAPSEPGK